ncbi:MAG: hypothetical protein VXW65_00980 [Pseudomonadota bacterium]|nr:hypothetical protein [Pseudomonadota bacterium]
MAHAAVPAATSADIAWFEGSWATAPADVEGYETILPEPPDCQRVVQIERLSPTAIRRVSTLKDGSVHAVDFEVKQFGANFPWWPVHDVGMALVAKRLDDQRFVLASTGEMGRADWNRGLQHIRCSSRP